MPYCYYTCNLLPLDLVVRSGHTPRWLGNYLQDANAPARRQALSIHPMTCPYVTKLVAAADALFGDAEAGSAAVAGGEAAGASRAGGTPSDGEASRTGGVPQAGAETRGTTEADCLVVPGGCDAMRRMGDLLAATYPDRVFVLSMPRSSGPEVTRTLATDLARLEDWLSARAPGGMVRRGAPLGADAAHAPGKAPQPGAPAVRAGAALSPQEPPTLEYPAPPRPGGVFLVAGPLSDDSLLRLIGQLGAHVSGLESCTSPDRWKPLRATDGAAATAAAAPEAGSDHAALAARLLDIGMCPRRSTADRRDHLARRLDETRPTSIIYARQSFCDPGAYDALLVAKLAEERGLPYLEIEVDFPFDAGGPLRTRVEAFLEAQLLDDDLLDDLLDGDDVLDYEPAAAAPPEED